LEFVANFGKFISVTCMLCVGRVEILNFLLRFNLAGLVEGELVGVVEAANAVNVLE
jgi:hypothetical protein